MILPGILLHSEWVSMNEPTKIITCPFCCHQRDWESLAVATGVIGIKGLADLVQGCIRCFAVVINKRLSLMNDPAARSRFHLEMQNCMPLNFGLKVFERGGRLTIENSTHTEINGTSYHIVP